MSERSKRAKKPRLRYLDLSFEGRNNVPRVPLDNGKRPHGGYRGCKKHPPSAFPQDKGRGDHQLKVRDEIDKLFEEEHLEVHGTPSWTLEVNREVTHNGESPLFLHKYMSPSKDDHTFQRLSKSAFSNPEKCSPPMMSRDGVTYYRPNRTHQYLTATELKDQSQSEVNLKYGRPTRTTLLRARQRTNSAPVNSYEVRRENMKREEELRSSCQYSNPKEFLQEVFSSGNGETFHSFITGARYNRAHCIDVKSLRLYGVYMPRNDPSACFVTGPNRMRDIYDIPCAPPDSPRSDVDEVSEPVSTRRPTTAPGYGRRPTPGATHPKQAWGDGDNTDRGAKGRSFEELIFWPTGLSVKGRSLGVSLKRTNSMPRLDSRLPSVQGISVDRTRKSRDPIEENSLINQPPPSPMATSTRDGGEKAASVHIEKQPDEPVKETTPKKSKPILVDRSVNVPSVSGESAQFDEDPFIKISACGVPVKSTNDVIVEENNNGKEFDRPVETASGCDLEDDQKTEGKNIDVEIPSVTDGASVEPMVPSSIQTDPLPATADRTDLTIDNMSSTSQEPEIQDDKLENRSEVDGDDQTQTIRDKVDVDASLVKVNCQTTENDTSVIESEPEQERMRNVSFFLTEDEDKKETIPSHIDDDISSRHMIILGDDPRPIVGQADQMPVPIVTVDEVSLDGGSEGEGQDESQGQKSNENDVAQEAVI